MPPRFSPRDWADPPTGFGTDEPVRWVEPTTPREAEQLLVAHYLHEVCREVALRFGRAGDVEGGAG